MKTDKEKAIKMYSKGKNAKYIAAMLGRRVEWVKYQVDPEVRRQQYEASKRYEEKKKNTLSYRIRKFFS
jgi:copper oxidase (laccase) domain-containing protein